MEKVKMEAVMCEEEKPMRHPGLIATHSQGNSLSSMRTDSVLPEWELIHHHEKGTKSSGGIYSNNSDNSH